MRPTFFSFRKVAPARTLSAWVRIQLRWTPSLPAERSVAPAPPERSHETTMPIKSDSTPDPASRSLTISYSPESRAVSGLLTLRPRTKSATIRGSRDSWQLSGKLRSRVRAFDTDFILA